MGRTEGFCFSSESSIFVLPLNNTCAFSHHWGGNVLSTQSKYIKYNRTANATTIPPLQDYSAATFFRSFSKPLSFFITDNNKKNVSFLVSFISFGVDC